jgi:hypothetical protein
MSTRSLVARPLPLPSASAQSALPRRRCACGMHSPAGAVCAACGRSRSGLQRKLAIGANTDPLEADADRIAARVMAMPARPQPVAREPCVGRDFSRLPLRAAAPADPSMPAMRPAPALRRQTRAGGVSIQTSVAQPRLQRAIKTVPTWAGEFRLDEYDATVGADNPDVNGADITMHFHPNERVDAEQIAFVQRVRSLVDGRPYTKDYGNAAWQRAALGRNIPAGETGQGSHIDQMPYSRTPVAGMKSESGNRLADPTPNPKYTEIGHRFTGPDGKLTQRDAMLHDEPNLVQPPTIEQAQEFETAALAIKGRQQGVYYGSVEWGWYKYPSQPHAQLSEFKLKSRDAPSAVFQRAAEVWNASQTSENKPSIQLPGMRPYRTSAATPLRAAPGKGKEIGRLGKHVRVALTDEHEPDNPPFWLNIVVTDGPLAGERGWVAATSLAPDTESKGGRK